MAGLPLSFPLQFGYSPSLETVGDAAYIPDMADRGVDRLLEQFKGKPRIEALLRAFLSVGQLAEDALWQLLVERSVDTAVGEQLDILGRIVVEPRRGRDDPEYRPFVKARILVNRANGRPDEMIAIAALLLPEDAVSLREWFPAGFILTFDQPLAGITTPHQLAALLRQAKPAGVGLMVSYATAAPEDTFTLAAAPPLASPLLGFESVTPADSANEPIDGELVFANADVPEEFDSTGFDIRVRPSINSGESGGTDRLLRYDGFPDNAHILLGPSAGRHVVRVRTPVPGGSINDSPPFDFVAGDEIGIRVDWGDGTPASGFFTVRVNDVDQSTTQIGSAGAASGGNWSSRTQPFRVGSASPGNLFPGTIFAPQSLAIAVTTDTRLGFGTVLDPNIGGRAAGAA